MGYPSSSTRKREHSSDDENADNSDSKKQKLADDIHDEVQCTICTEMFVNATTLSCSHTFCKYCIEEWKKNHPSCPICRAKITSLSRSLVIDSIIERIIENSSKEVQDQRRDVVDKRNAVSRTSAINTATVANSDSDSNTDIFDTVTVSNTDIVDIASNTASRSINSINTLLTFSVNIIKIMNLIFSLLSNDD